MGKRPTSLHIQKKSKGSPKTAKRLAIKQIMLAAKKPAKKKRI